MDSNRSSPESMSAAPPWTMSLAGFLSGIFAGLVMAGVSILYSLAVGAGIWYPLQLIGAVAHPASIAAGLIAHFVVSGFLGALFSTWIKPTTSVGAAFWGGILFAVLVWVFATYIGLPIFNPTMAIRVVLNPGIWFLEHLFFGGSLFLTPVLMRRFLRAKKKPLNFRSAA